MIFTCSLLFFIYSFHLQVISCFNQEIFQLKDDWNTDNMRNESFHRLLGNLLPMEQVSLGFRAKYRRFDYNKAYVASCKDDSTIMVYYSPMLNNRHPDHSRTNQSEVLVKPITAVYRFIDSLIDILKEKKIKNKNVLLWLDDVYINSEEFNVLPLLKFMLEKYITCSECYNEAEFRLVKSTYGLDQIGHIHGCLSTITNDFQLYSLDVQDKTKAKFSNECFKYINSRKYESNCMPYPDKLIGLLITGLGGSGTHYISNILRGLHIDVLHEAWQGKYGAVSWTYGVNDAAIGIEYPHRSHISGEYHLWSPRFEYVVHVVRCPMRQISSVSAHAETTFDFIRNYALETFRELSDSDNGFMSLSSPDYHWKILFQNQFEIARYGGIGCRRESRCNLMVSAFSWVYWNRLLQGYADITLHSESTDEIITAVCNHQRWSKVGFVIDHKEESNCEKYLNADSNGRKDIIQEILNLTVHIRQKQNRWYDKRYAAAKLFHAAQEKLKQQQSSSNRRLLDSVHDPDDPTPWEQGFRFGSFQQNSHEEYEISQVRLNNPNLADEIEMYSNELKFKNTNECH